MYFPISTKASLKQHIEYFVFRHRMQLDHPYGNRHFVGEDVANFILADPSSEFGHAQMIIDLMDPSNYNNNYYKDRFLGNMYRIVSRQSVSQLDHDLRMSNSDCFRCGVAGRTDGKTTPTSSAMLPRRNA